MLSNFLRLLLLPTRWLLGLFRSRVHGDARWMNALERRRFLHPRHRGLVLSPKHRLSLQDSFKNLALVAPTGLGKTTRYVIPNVLLAEGSVVVTDPAGEIFASTSGHLRDRGFEIQVLQPTKLEQSQCFNPLRFWRTPQELRQLATILAQNASGVQSDPFWTISATNLLAVLLSAVVTVEKHANLEKLRWLLNHVDGGKKAEIDGFLSRQLDDRGFAEYAAFCAADAKVRASIVASARAAVELWADPQICHFTASNSVNLAVLRRELTAIYLIVPEHQVRYFGLLLNLFYSACFDHCLRNSGSDALPVFFFLDEFGNLGPIANFAAIITTLRKRRCSVSIILQDLAQLDTVYGRAAARTIFSGGCANKLFFGGLDLETALYVEKVLGQNTAYDTLFGGVAEHARTIAVPLLRADEIRMLSAAEGILISGRERPVRIKVPPFFEVAGWARKMAKTKES